jgi:hypothetical protein
MNLTQTGVPRPLWRLRAAVIGTIVVLTVGITAWPAAADGTAPPTAGAANRRSRVTLVHGARTDVFAMVGGPMAVDA